MTVNPVSPSTCRFNPASSAHLAALKLIAQIVCGNKEIVTINHGVETTP